MISASDINTLRSIACAGADYGTVKRLLEERGWKIDEDNTDLGFLRVFIPDAADKCYRLIIGYRDPDWPPYSLITFWLFPDSKEQLPAFDSAFRTAAETLARYLGAPAMTGKRQPSFRTWSYAYQRWSLP